MARKKGNVEIGYRTYEEICRIFENAHKAAKKMGVRKNVVYDWGAGCVPGGHYLAVLNHYGADVRYIVSGVKNNGQWVDVAGCRTICNHCGEYPLYDYWGKLKLSTYCPNCGADMRERKDNEN